MSREPRLGPPGQAPAVPAGRQDARRQATAIRDTPQDHGRRAPLMARSGDATTTEEASRPARRLSGPPGDAVRPQRPSLGGGLPAQQRGLGAQGRQTVQRLLDAGLAVLDELGLSATRVEDIVRRAKTSHGTFYLYFANKDDLLRTLLQDALHDIAIVTGEFPVVTSNEAGRAALRRWVQHFSDIYAKHATVLRIVSQAELVGEDVYGDGLQLLFRLAEAMTQGMTAAQRATDGEPPPHAELTAVACLMMLERVNYLLCAEVKMPVDEMNERLAAIIYAAFRSP
jgi:AcrR family transcriptional regulator